MTRKKEPFSLLKQFLVGSPEDPDEEVSIVTSLPLHIFLALQFPAVVGKVLPELYLTHLCMLRFWTPDHLFLLLEM